MNNAWTGLEKAPQGSIKNKIHGVGLWLLVRLKPSEIFLKSISKDVTGVEITYPTSLNARLVRRRSRHMAMSGTIIHKKCLYGSAALLPISTVFMGSQNLLRLVSDGSDRGVDNKEDTAEQKNGSDRGVDIIVHITMMFRLISDGNTDTGLAKGIHARPLN